MLSPRPKRAQNEKEVRGKYIFDADDQQANARSQWNLWSIARESLKLRQTVARFESEVK